MKTVKAAERVTRGVIMPTIAFKKGALRRGIATALNKEKNSVVAKRNYIKISLRKSMVVEPHYARYHIHRGAKFGKTYENPTTKNTKPFDTRVYNRLLAKNIIKKLPEQGFKVTAF